MHRVLLTPMLVVGMASAALGQASPDTPPSANPARPTVTNPATLPPVGYLQFEQGYLGSLNSPNTASQYGVNQVTKIAVHPRLLFAVSSQPFAVSTINGAAITSRDAGAVQVGFQAVLFTPTLAQPPSKSSTDTAPAASTPAAPASDGKSPVPTVAAGYFHTVYLGTAPDVDLGSPTNTALMLLSGDFGGFHYDSNFIINEQDGNSNVDGHGVRRAQFAQTLSVNHSVFNPNLQLSVEVYHFTQPLVGATSSSQAVARANLFDALIAPSYQPRPNLVIDFGFSHGFTSTSTRWQSFVGFTYLLPKRLWPERR
ncbi:MAG: transporter [Acidobacteriota bacterium]|nr:transporter [Acidobacteriota bacterium]